jgi:hypothetical protein
LNPILKKVGKKALLAHGLPYFLFEFLSFHKNVCMISRALCWSSLLFLFS